ncbi:MAG: hypothetical protein AAF629_37400, partial [Chloroflexota bacterium]
MKAQDFNFYQELTRQDNYRLLLPRRDVLLTVVQLYQREKAGEFDSEGGKFTEDIILECLHIANPPEQRVPHEKNNQIIKELLHYFLWRNDDSGRYSLKEYARELCGLIQNRLQDQFNPTQTEKFFNILVNELERAWQKIDSVPESFNDWVDNVLKKYQPDIQRQVEILDKKVDEAVMKIR